MYAASAVGDHGLIWAALAGVEGRLRGRSWRPLGRASAALAAESVLVNGLVKLGFQRERPTSDEPRPLPLRIPLTSSFPSGHASSAFFAAALLRRRSTWLLYYPLAIVVASSRVHVRIHYASDVVAGALLGTALGELTRRAFPVWVPARRRAGTTSAEAGLYPYVLSSFDVTWDYLCPFARNAHEHLVLALRAGAGWEARFRFFSLSQAHVAEGGPPVWEDPAARSGVLAGLAGLVVRERHPESFWTPTWLFSRPVTTRAKICREPRVVAAALDAVGLDGSALVEEAKGGWAVDLAREEHTELATRWDVFGVPTFIAGDRAVFVRLMHRPGGDAKLAERTIERVLDLMDEFPELNEYKFTTLGR